MNRRHRRFLGSTFLSYDLTDFELVHFFALTDHEREAVRGRYKPNHRIAAAIQIGFLKLAGRPLTECSVSSGRGQKVSVENVDRLSGRQGPWSLPCVVEPRRIRPRVTRIHCGFYVIVNKNVCMPLIEYSVISA
ncbi:MAG: DUF4158 domain-containing protein [Nitrospira sp.]|nr:DUF4158 domain-containing protein [Nitrospira sp.]MDH4370791.1 DUF4158 domain-containing protein [Nitrospira sp.]MDH5348208.1 DUF4158 domain-containing protein [Nitrospira sp.]MDH5498447.1 DUF4158 domain-containing protein [Nitrospira sp.]MDH5724936.1 DUF4158 domain-containing protein [Nitrospira sp.]